VGSPSGAAGVDWRARRRRAAVCAMVVSRAGTRTTTVGQGGRPREAASPVRVRPRSSVRRSRDIIFENAFDRLAAAGELRTGRPALGVRGSGGRL